MAFGPILTSMSYMSVLDVLQAKKERLKQAAAAKAAGETTAPGAKKLVLKYGLKHVTELIENKKVRQQ